MTAADTAGPPIRLAVLDDYQGVALTATDWSNLRGRVEVVTFDDHIADETALAGRLADFDAVVVMRERTPLPATVIGRLPRLRLIVTTGRTNAVIDVDAARARDITVCGTRGSGNGAPELSWGLLLSLVRHIPSEDAAVRAGGWQRTVGFELAGRTIGLLGLGAIGARVARYAHAFDMSVIAWSQNLTAERAGECGARLVDRQELFAAADIVSVHLKLSDRTRGLVGATELAALGPRGYLVNTSRAPIVDRGALIAALRARSIAGAALDVFDTEPLPAGDELRTLPNTVVTPHLGYVTDAAYQRFFADVVEDVDAWIAGAPIRTLT
jgi:phosphoglycerate dehydrogenase-like enzyme